MDFIDTSNKSIAFGIISFILLGYIFYRIFYDNKQYVLDRFVFDLTDNRIYLFSIILALLLTFGLLVLFKEYLKKMGQYTFLDEPFEIKKKI